MRRLAVVVGLVAVVGLLFTFGLRTKSGRENVASPLMNRPVPLFAAPVFDSHRPQYGEEFALSDNLDKPVVINFWASWCAPCKYEAPVLQAAWRKYEGDVLIVGVDTLEERIGDAEAFVADYGLTFPIVSDVGNKISIDYGIFGVPETYFVRTDGTLAYKHSGPVTPEIVDEYVQALLETANSAQSPEFSV